MLTIRPALGVHVRQRPPDDRNGASPSPGGCGEAVGEVLHRRHVLEAALFTTMSTSASSRPTASESARATPSARPPASAATAFAASTLRSTTRTAAPAAASRRAHARPMPLPPPVTRAVRPDRSTCTTWGTATGSAVMAQEVTSCVAGGTWGGDTYSPAALCGAIRPTGVGSRPACPHRRASGPTSRVSNTRTAGGTGEEAACACSASIRG
jgi:hypothetical protein